MGSPRVLRLLPVLLLTCVTAASAVPAGAAPRALQPPARIQVQDVPAWATAANQVGRAAPAGTAVFSVWLGWRDQPLLDRTLSGLFDPSSPSYHQWLTPREFHQAFSPSRTDVASVESWLTGHGFDIIDVPRNRVFVTAAGTTAQVEQAFQVDERMYSVDGSTLRAPDRAPTVPAGLAPDVMAVTGLDSALDLARPDHASAPPPPPSGTSVGPCSQYWNAQSSTAFTNPFRAGAALPWIICGYQPAQIDDAYGISDLQREGLDGRGQKVAIVGTFFSPTIRRDANHFSEEFHLPRLNGHNYRQLVAPGTLRYGRDPSDAQSWYIEQALDVEWTHAVAPRADIVYVGAANDSRGLDQAINYAVDHHVANIISNSWGLPEAWASRGEIRALNGVFEQAAAEGIGVYFASGDDGDNKDVVGSKSVGFPDSDPWVTSVGGTSLAVGPEGQYEGETGWGTTSTDWNGARWAPKAPGQFLYGSGGGVSHVFAEPAWQKPVVPAADASWKGRSHRAEPDISMDADPQTGVVFSQTYVDPDGRQRIIDSWIGGTSVAAPLTAGLMALADEHSGRPHGFISPSLYALAGTAAFHDVQSPPNPLAVLRNQLLPSGKIQTHLRTLDRDSSLHTAVGWDPVTGIGSPNAPELLHLLG